MKAKLLALSSLGPLATVARNATEGIGDDVRAKGEVMDDAAEA